MFGILVYIWRWMFWHFGCFEPWTFCLWMFCTHSGWMNAGSSSTIPQIHLDKFSNCTGYNNTLYQVGTQAGTIPFQTIAPRNTRQTISLMLHFFYEFKTSPASFLEVWAIRIHRPCYSISEFLFYIGKKFYSDKLIFGMLVKSISSRCHCQPAQSDIYKCNKKRFLDGHIRAHGSAFLCSR